MAFRLPVASITTEAISPLVSVRNWSTGLPCNGLMVCSIPICFFAKRPRVIAHIHRYNRGTRYAGKLHGTQ